MNKFTIIAATFLGATVIGVSTPTNSGPGSAVSPLGPVASTTGKIVTPGPGNMGNSLMLGANNTYWESHGMG